MKGWTALHLAANGADDGGYRPILLEPLMAKGADPQVDVVKNGTPTSLLFRAASTGHADALYTLLAMPGKFDPYEEHIKASRDSKREEVWTLADAAHMCNHELEEWLRQWYGIEYHAPSHTYFK